MLIRTVQIDKDALEFVVTRGNGPYAGKWHKENHTGPLTCAGCAMEQALAAKDALAHAESL